MIAQIRPRVVRLIKRQPRHNRALRALTTALLLGVIGACSAQTDSSLPTADSSRSFTATLIRVVDGDSLEVRDRIGKKHRLRLAGIDAPESRQTGGRAATEALRRLLGKGRMRVTVGKTDRYRRLIANVRVDRRDVSQAMLTAGMAWFYRRFEQELPLARRQSYDAAEKTARALGRGLWAQSNPMAPWEFRRRKPSR